MKYIVRFVLVVVAIGLIATALKGMADTVPVYNPVQTVDALF